MSRITPHTQAKIIATLHSRPDHTWRGTRKGVSYTLRIDAQPDLNGNRIAYRFTYRRERIKGRAPTVPVALAEIEATIHNMLESRP